MGLGEKRMCMTIGAIKDLSGSAIMANTNLTLPSGKWGLVVILVVWNIPKAFKWSLPKRTIQQIFSYASLTLWYNRILNFIFEQSLQILSFLTRSHVTNYNLLQILLINCAISIGWKFVDYPAMECKFYQVFRIRIVAAKLVAKMSIYVIVSIWSVVIKDTFRLARNVHELRTVTVSMANVW